MTRDDRFQTLLPLSRVPEAAVSDAALSGVGSTVAAHTLLDVNALLPAVIQAVPSALIVVDADFRIIVDNPAALSALGVRQASLVGYNLTRFCSIERIERALAHLRVHPGPFKYTERIPRGGKVLDVEVSADILVAPTGEYLCLCLTEITPPERMQIERSMPLVANSTYFERAQQLEALRHVTRTFAHDFNNLLSVVMASLEAAARRIKKRSESALDDIERAFIATDRSVRLTAQILEYAKREETKTELLAPGTEILALRGLIELLVGDEIELTILAQSSLEVSISASQLETSVLNLVINSRDAIRERGAIEISIESRAVSDNEASELQVGAGPYVVVGVRDDGCGMSQDVRRRAIEPFFTTKPQGRGTGLGLSSVSGIMRNAGGCLHIASSEQPGTLVELYFPVAIRS